MKPFIFEQRNGIHIVDLAKTADLLQEACEFLRKTTLKGGKILWVGTKKQAQESIREAAASTQMFSVTERWVGGTFAPRVDCSPCEGATGDFEANKAGDFAKFAIMSHRVAAWVPQDSKKGFKAVQEGVNEAQP